MYSVSRKYTFTLDRRNATPKVKSDCPTNKIGKSTQRPLGPMPNANVTASRTTTASRKLTEFERSDVVGKLSRGKFTLLMSDALPVMLPIAESTEVAK